jgi:hypothetical protein
MTQPPVTVRATDPVERHCARRGVSPSVGCLFLTSGSVAAGQSGVIQTGETGRRSTSESALRVQLVPQHCEDPAYYIADCGRDANQEQRDANVEFLDNVDWPYEMNPENKID